MRLAPIAGLTVATLVSYREILLPGRVLSDFDVWLYFYPLRAYAARAIQEGRFPLWNPDTFLGAPFFANPQTSLLYPGTALFYVLPVGYAYSLSVVLHVLLAALFMYAFLRRAWAVSEVAAFVGALGFAFGGFLSSQVGHINQLSASAWLPAVALCADTALRHRSVRWAIAGALALAVQLLAGHAQESYMTVWVVAIVLVWRMLVASEPEDRRADARATTSAPSPLQTGQTRRREVGAYVRRVVGRLPAAIWVGAVVLGVGFGLASVQLVPTAELSAASIRGGGMSTAEAISFSLAPTHLVRSVLPGYWYNLSSEEMGHIGAMGLGFAALGLMAGRWRPVLCAAALAGLGIFFALGGANPLYVPMLGSVPGLGLFRVPSRWLFVFTFGAASLAALGVHWAFTNRSPRGSQDGSPAHPRSDPYRHRGSGDGPSTLRVALTGGLLVGVLGVAASLTTPVPGRIVLLWLAGFGAALGFTVAARARPSRGLAVALVLLVGGELVAAGMDLPQRYPAPSAVLDGERPVPSYLLRSPPAGRILSIAPTEYLLEDEAQLADRYALPPTGHFYFTSDLKLDEVMSPNVPLRYGLSTVDGFDGGVLPLRQFLRMASLMVPPDEIRADGVLRTRLIAIPDAFYLELFNIRAIIASQAVDPVIDGIRYDVATARRVAPERGVVVETPSQRPARVVSLLGSVEIEPGGAGEGRLIVRLADGTILDRALRLGEDLFRSTEPGPLRSPQPTAGLSRRGRIDSVTPIELPSASPISHIEFGWRGEGVWELRAVALIGEDGSQEQLMLQPGLKRTMFPVMKLYERVDPPGPTLLLRNYETVPDEEAFSRLQARAGEGVSHAPSSSQTVMLATGDAEVPRPVRYDELPGAFVRRPGPPERIVYQRQQGGSDGYLVIDDAWFPGWHAEVDGVPTPVYRAYIGYKAVFVPAEGQTVVLTYAPRSLTVGVMVTALSILLAALLLFSPALHRYARSRWAGR